MDDIMATRNFETGAQSSAYDYQASVDPAIKAGANDRPGDIYQYIGKRDFSDLLISFTIGARFSKTNKESLAIRRRLNKKPQKDK